MFNIFSQYPTFVVFLAVVGKTEGAGKHRRDDEGERLG